MDSTVCTCMFAQDAAVRVWACPRAPGLTDDDGSDLVPAGPVLVLDLAGEGGVDGVIHLPHRQLVAVHHHGLRQRTGRAGQMKKDGEKEGDVRIDGTEGEIVICAGRN